MAHITDEQESAIVNGIERLSYALQVFANRAAGEIGLGAAAELMKIGAEVNKSISEAFPHVIVVDDVAEEEE